MRAIQLPSARLWLAGLANICISFAASLPARDTSSTSTTITVPETVTNHGDPNLFCTPTKWTDVAVFFFGNYAAHAATVVSYPGEPSYNMMLNIALALIYPISGALRGLTAIFRHAAFKKDPRERALQAGALCMVARLADWRPEPGEQIETLTYVSNRLLENLKELNKSPSKLSQLERLRQLRHPSNELKELTGRKDPVELRVLTSPPWLMETSAWPLFENSIKTISPRCTIHGTVRLPQGYGLAYVPKDAALQPIKASEVPVDNYRERTTYREDITCSYSFSSALLAIIQAIYGSITLYQSRGDQVQEYGFAAFGLTVVPYVVMSVINLISTAVNPEYASIYLVGSETMDEAISRGGEFHGVIGRLENEEVRVEPARTVLFSAAYEADEKGSEQYLHCQIPPIGNYDHDTPGELRLRISDGPPEAVRPNLSRHLTEGFAFETAPSLHTSFISIPSCHNFKRSSTGTGSMDFDDPKLFTHLFTVKRDLMIVVPKLFTMRLQFSAWHISRLAPFICGVAVGAISIAIIGGISQFDSGSSSLAQRVWTTAWLAAGIVFGALASEATPFNVRGPLGMLQMFLVNMIFAAPAIGGFVVVSQMLKDYGTCNSLG